MSATNHRPVALILALVALPALGCGGARSATSTASAAPTAHEHPHEAPTFDGPRGSFDDLPVADDDLLRLEALLEAKWSYFLLEMDRYNRARSSAGNAAMAGRLRRVFADRFVWRVIDGEGELFGPAQGELTPEKWVEVNDAERTFGRAGPHSGLFVPSYDHVLYVKAPGRTVVLEGYHEHLFVGADVRLIVGDARHLAHEVITFEKVGGVWRMTDYVEVIYSASELPIPALPTP